MKVFDTCIDFGELEQKRRKLKMECLLITTVISERQGSLSEREQGFAHDGSVAVHPGPNSALSHPCK